MYYCTIYCSIAVHFAVYFAVPVVELVDVLDVSEHDVVLVGETRRDVLRAARHLPQVRLHQGKVLLLGHTIHCDVVLHGIMYRFNV